MKILHIDHIGIAAKEMEAALSFFTDKLGMEATGFETIEDQAVRVAFLPLSEGELEILESTKPDGPVAKFIESRGEGVQHIALRVDDLEGALKELKQKGVRLIDERPRIGAGGARIAFIHPKETHGVLLELCERHSV
ncbi:MAG: methylmalonyl-CoA epimerase [Thermodesulfobacteriota bacterium]